MLGRSSCVGGPGIMNNDFYGNGKTTCRLGREKATQYAFAMKAEVEGSDQKRVHGNQKNEEMKPVHIRCQKKMKGKEICLLFATVHVAVPPSRPMLLRSIPFQPETQDPKPITLQKKKSERKRKDALITGSRSIPLCTLAVSLLLAVVSVGVCFFHPWAPCSKIQ